MGKNKNKVKLFFRVQGTSKVYPTTFIKIDQISSVEDDGETISVKMVEGADIQMNAYESVLFRQAMEANSVMVGPVDHKILPDEEPDADTDQNLVNARQGTRHSDHFTGFERDQDTSDTGDTYEHGETEDTLADEDDGKIAALPRTSDMPAGNMIMATGRKVASLK